MKLIGWSVRPYALNFIWCSLYQAFAITWTLFRDRIDQYFILEKSSSKRETKPAQLWPVAKHKLQMENYNYMLWYSESKTLLICEITFPLRAACTFEMYFSETEKIRVYKKKILESGKKKTAWELSEGICLQQ